MDGAPAVRYAYFSMGATSDIYLLLAIDAFSTALVMENADVVSEILQYIPTINFNTTADPTITLSLFETTIRYLGGLLAGKCWNLSDEFVMLTCFRI